MTTTRSRRPALAAGLALLLCPLSRAQTGDRPLTPGRPHPDTLAGPPTTLVGLLGRLRPGPAGGFGRGAGILYEADLRSELGPPLGDIPLFAVARVINLKAGAAMTVTASATGSGRSVGLVLVDPEGRLVGQAAAAPRRATLSVGEAAATGRHRLVVYSDRVGAVTIQVDAGGEAEESSEAALAERLAELEREVERVKARLREVRAKKP